MNMQLYKRFCQEEFNEHGTLTRFSIHHPDNFNFAYDVMDVLAAEEPDSEALVWCNVAGEERRFTYGELGELSNRTANALRRAGVNKGDRVMLMLKRHHEYWTTILALHKLGAVAVPATHMLTVKDIVYRVQAASIKAVVCTPEGELADYVAEARKVCPTLTIPCIVRQPKEGFLFLDEAVQAASPVLERTDTLATDPMIMYFTSGTTGYPKAVIHDFTYALAHIVTAVHWQNVKEGGLHLTVADTGWGKASWGKLYGQWLAGVRVMVYDFDKFVAADLMGIIQKYRVTSFCAPPTIYRFLIKEGMDGYDLSSLEYATNAGEALNYEVYRRFLENTGIHLMEGFGQTETTLLIANMKELVSKIQEVYATFSTDPWASPPPCTTWPSSTGRGTRWPPARWAKSWCAPAKPGGSTGFSARIITTTRCTPRPGRAGSTTRGTPLTSTRTGITGTSGGWTTSSNPAATASGRSKSRACSWSTRRCWNAPSPACPTRSAARWSRPPSC